MTPALWQFALQFAPYHWKLSRTTGFVVPNSRRRRLSTYSYITTKPFSYGA